MPPKSPRRPSADAARKSAPSKPTPATLENTPAPKVDAKPAPTPEAASAPVKAAAKPAAKSRVRVAKAATPAPTAAPVAPAVPLPSAADEHLIARIARAIAKADPRCAIPAHEITDTTEVPMTGLYAGLARAALAASQG